MVFIEESKHILKNSKKPKIEEYIFRKMTDKT